MQERKPRKPKLYGQKPLPGIEADIEAEAVKNERPIGCPPLGEVINYTAQLGLTTGDAEQIYDAWLASGFRLSAGAAGKIRDWKAVVRTWYRKGLFLSQKKAAAAMDDLKAKQAIRRMKGGN